MEKLITKESHLLISAISCFVCLSLLSRTLKGDEWFNYDQCSDRGPKHWGELKKEWRKCNNGIIQSPISLSNWSANSNNTFTHLTRNHNPADAIFINRGYEVIIVWVEDAGSIKIDNVDYHLKSYRWHHPSEHTQDGKRYPLELHMVHTNNNPSVTYNTAVVSVLFEYGPPDPLISSIEMKIKNIVGGEEFLGRLDPKVAKFDGSKYLRYIGSLTTPPCTEDVIWTLMKKVQTISPYQGGLFKQAIVGEANARPLQKINGRDVFYFDPSSLESAAD